MKLRQQLEETLNVLGLKTEENESLSDRLRRLATEHKKYQEQAAALKASLDETMEALGMTTRKNQTLSEQFAQLVQHYEQLKRDQAKGSLREGQLHAALDAALTELDVLDGELQKLRWAMLSTPAYPRPTADTRATIPTIRTRPPPPAPRAQCRGRQRTQRAHQRRAHISQFDANKPRHD